MTDIKTPITSATPSLNESASSAASISIEVAKPSISQRYHEPNQAPQETISIFKRAVHAHLKISSLDTTDDILSALVAETDDSAETILENLSRGYFQSKSDFDTHLRAFRNSLLAANNSLSAKKEPITLKKAYETYRDCRSAILKNREADVFEWESQDLVYLPPEIDQLIKVTSISLYKNKLSTLPSTIWHLKELTKLNLNHNIMTSLSEDIKKLTTLTELYLMDNCLETLPSQIGDLINLNKAYFGQNRLTFLPEMLGNLVNLTMLNIEENTLVALPKSLGNLVNLITLLAFQNQLTALPDSFVNLRSLTRLYLNNNQFSISPPEIDSLNLEVLNLNTNPCTLIDEIDSEYIEL